MLQTQTENSMSRPDRFLDPRVLGAISSLQLLAKTVVDGVMLGAHVNPVPGVGLEFNQYRGYQPGDDLRLLDWKMFARSDRYFIREAEVETSISIRLILDTSASMAHRDDNGISKLDYARYLIASLGYLAFQQGDAIGLYALNDREGAYLPPSRHRRHLYRFLRTLETRSATGVWPEWEQCAGRLSDQQRRGLLVVASDLNEHRGEILQVLSKLAGLKNEILVFHLIAANELNLPYRGPVTLEDLETGKTIQVVPDAIRESHHHALIQDADRLRDELYDKQIAYERLILDQPLDQALRSFLAKRAKSG